MSNNATVVMQWGDLPPNTCWPSNPQDFVTLISTLLSAYLPGNYSTFNFGSSTPSPDDQDKPWVKTDNSGYLVGLYVYAGGFWVRPHPVPPSSQVRTIWRGTEADLWAFDGGDGTDPSTSAPTATSGAMWQRDTDFGGDSSVFRIPIGAGTNPTTYDGNPATTIPIGGTGGQERSLLSDTDIAHTHFVASGDSATRNNGLGTASKEFIVAHGTSNSADAGEYDLSGGATEPSIGTTSDVNGATPPADGRTTHSCLPPYLGVLFIKRTARVYYTA